MKLIVRKFIIIILHFITVAFEFDGTLSVEDMKEEVKYYNKLSKSVM